MSPLQGVNNRIHYGGLRRGAFLVWDRERCWHGEKVGVCIRTEKVDSGVKVDIDIAPKTGGDAVDTLQGEALTDGKIDHEYTVNWKGKALGKTREFVLKSIIDGKLKEGPSDPLYVELDPPVFSA